MAGDGDTDVIGERDEAGGVVARVLAEILPEYGFAGLESRVRTLDRYVLGKAVERREFTGKVPVNEDRSCALKATQVES